MATIKSSVQLALLLLVVLVAMVAVNMELVEADCNSLKKGLTPCTSYLLSKANIRPTAACCASVKSLNANSKGKQRKADCNCLKGLAIQLKSLLNQKHATDLPKLCGVSLAIPVSPYTDCSKA